MDYLRVELENNPRIRADYGPVDVHGAEAEWVAEFGDRSAAFRSPSEEPRHRSVKLEAFGMRMSPRGRRFRQHRPVEFVGDDLETAELARSPVRERNLWDWLMDEVVPALDPDRFVFTVLGTMFGPGCMIECARRLAAERDPSGRPLARLFLQRATHGGDSGGPLQGSSVWPERFSDEFLARLRRTVGLRSWLRNYALVAEDPSRPFQPAWVGLYEPGQVDSGSLDVVCFLDPAISEAPTGCPRALIAVGCDRSTGVRYVLDAWIERGSPMVMVDKVIEFNRRLRPRIIGIEQNGGFALIKPLLEMRAGRTDLPVRYVQHNRPKAIRIERLSPQFEAGRWRFPLNPNAGVRTLQEQFLSYPDGYVDGPDACAGCDELLPPAFGASQEPRYVTLSRRTDLSGL
jgi:predicted phage terminase large subunit-like protein